MLKRLFPLVGVFVFALVWLAIDASHIVRPLFWPTLPSVIYSLWESLSDKIGLTLTHLGFSLYRTLLGFLIASILAVPLGILIGLSKKIYSATEILIDFFRSLPVIAVFPLFLLLFGLGEPAKIALAAFFSFWVILVNSIYGVWNASQLRIMVGKVFRATKLQLLKEIIFFDALPQIFIGLRIALSFSLLIVVASEMFIGTKFGIGQVIFDSYMTFRTPQLFAFILIAGILGYILSKCFYVFEKRIVHWVGK